MNETPNHPPTKSEQNAKQANIYVNIKGDTFGPYTEHELAQCVREKKILQQDYAWTSGFEEWVKVEDILCVWEERSDVSSSVEEQESSQTQTRDLEMRVSMPCKLNAETVSRAAPVPNNIIESAIKIIGTTGIDDEEVEKKVRCLVSDDMTARRLIDWIREAFGFVLISHIRAKIIPPTTFSAKDCSGDWVTFKLNVEPIFISALQIAMRMFHEGPRETFMNLSRRSSMLSVVNQALWDKVNIDGSKLTGLYLLGIPAEIYLAPSEPL